MTAVLRTVTLGVAALLLLSGCTPPSPAPTSTPTSTAGSATPTPTATAAPGPTMPDLAGQELLTITAIATAGGVAMNVAMTVYYPVTADSTAGQQIAEYLTASGSSSDVADPAFIASHGAVYQLIALKATGSAFPSDSAVLPLFGPGRTDTVVGIPAASVGGNRLSLIAPGEGYGVAALYAADNSPTDPATWADRFAYYGFQDNFAGSIVTNCSITKTPLAMQSAPVAEWDDLNCFTGRGD